MLAHRVFENIEPCKNRSRCGFVEAALRRHGIITSKLPLARPRVCKHAPVLAHRALKTLNHAKPQQVRFFVEAAFAASWYNNLKAAAGRARVQNHTPLMLAHRV